MKNRFLETYIMLDVRQEDIPNDGNHIDIKYAKGRWDPSKIKILRGRPYNPIKL